MDVMLRDADREAEERGRWQDEEIAIEEEMARLRDEDDELLEAVEDYDEFTDIYAPFKEWVVAVAQSNTVLRDKAACEMEFIIRDALRRQAQMNVRRPRDE